MYLLMMPLGGRGSAHCRDTLSEVIAVAVSDLGALGAAGGDTCAHTVIVIVLTVTCTYVHVRMYNTYVRTYVHAGACIQN